MGDNQTNAKCQNLVNFMKSKANFVKVITNTLKTPILPSPSLLASIDQETFESFIEWFISGLSTSATPRHSFSEHTLAWVYGLLTLVQVPLLDTGAANLTQLLLKIDDSHMDIKIAIPAPDTTELEACHKIACISIVYLLTCQSNS